MPRVPWILALILMGCQRADPEVDPGPGSEVSAFAGSGSCLSCPAHEAKLWAEVKADATIAWPLIARAVMERLDRAPA